MTVFLTCFSATHNFRKLLSVPASGNISCLHGLRVLSMVWIVAAHTYLAVYMTGIMGKSTSAVTRQTARFSVLCYL